jgi:hypothetical protein
MNADGCTEMVPGPDLCAAEEENARSLPPVAVRLGGGIAIRRHECRRGTPGGVRYIGRICAGLGMYLLPRESLFFGRGQVGNLPHSQAEACATTNGS